MGWEEAVRPSSSGAVLDVEARPGSSAPGSFSYDSWRKRLRIALAERAERGRANAELLDRVSKALGVPRGALSLASGERSRSKTIAVTGLSRSEALRRLSSALGWDAPGAGGLAGRLSRGRREIQHPDRSGGS
ncbi:MAG: DUF167 domain-containing protein [Thermoplasmatota archaeon]